MKELMKTIRNMANANTTISTAVSSDVWWDDAPANTTMPYIVYYNVADGPIRCFDPNADMAEYWIQFSIYSKTSAAAAENLASDLALVFDRQTISYDSKTHVSCERMPGGTGPTKLEDAWQRTVDYLFRCTK
jgi:hypothetical protein